MPAQRSSVPRSPVRSRRRPALKRAALGSLLVLAIAASADPARAGSGVYVAAFGADAVAQFDLAPAFAPLAPATVAGGSEPQAVVVSPDGRSVYVADYGDGGVRQFDVGADGRLSPKTPAAVAGAARASAIAISPDGRSVYVADYDSGTVAQYDVGPGGPLSPKVPATVAAAQKPAGVAVSPDGRSVYVTNYGAASVSQFDVGAGGRLSPKTPAAVGGVPTPAGLAVSPDGGSVYVANFGAGDNRISQFGIAAGGVLHAKTPATVVSGTSPVAVAVSPDGKSAYVTNSGDDTVSQFDIAAGGALRLKAPATVAAGAYPYGIAASPDGTSVLVTNADGNSVSQYAVGGGGALTRRVTVATATFPAGIAISPERPGAPSVSIASPVDGASFALQSAASASYTCSPGAHGGVLKSCAGSVANGSPIDTATAGAHTLTVTAIDADGQTATATSHYTVTGPPSPPRNTALPSIVPASTCPQVGACRVIPHTYECRPGTWSGADPARPYRYAWQRLTPDKRFLTGFRAETVAITASYRATAETNLQLLNLSWRFQCVVTAANGGGSASAVSPAKDLVPVLDRLGGTTTYGNLRIRGIDVFQTVQPTAQARAFGYDPNVRASDPSQAFGFDLAGGGTPTSYRRTFFGAALPAGADPQRTRYAGVPFDATKPATAVVYVDVTEILPGYRGDQPIQVTLSARADGVPLAGAMTRTVRGTYFGDTPYVTAAERGDPDAGVQFAIPAAWFDRAAAGARLDLQAQVALPLSFSTHVVQCTLAPCTADDRYRVDDLPVQRLPQIRIRSVNLRETADTWTTTPQQVLQRATQIYPGGERMQIAGSGAVISIETITHWTIASKPCAPWKELEKTTPGLGLRLCRMSAIDMLLNAWEAGNQGGAPYDVLLGIHEYGNEPGWTQSARPTFATLPSALGHPTFTANRGDFNRPLTAAAHELGHVLGLPHAGQACPTPIGTATNLTGPGTGQAGEYWPADDRGRLQGVKFDRTAPTVGGQIDPVVDTGEDPGPLAGSEPAPTPGNLMDLMSYCGVRDDTTFPWLSARNWNHTFRVLQDWAGRLSAADRAARLAAAPSSPGALALGVVGPSGGHIDRLTASADPAPASVPSSPVRLRSFDAAGTLLRDAGVEIRGTSEAPTGTGSFAGSVPPAAAAIELVRDGTVLDRFERSRPPTVRLRPFRHGRAGLVRWVSSDPDHTALQAMVDYSPNGGRTWTTVFMGQDHGQAHIPARAFSASRNARIRVRVSDGFSEAHARSRRLSTAGRAPTVRIVRPAAGEPLRSGVPTLLIGSALDDTQHALPTRALTWYAGHRRLGTGAELTARLPAGRESLRLEARGHDGRTASARLTVHVQPPPLRIASIAYRSHVPRHTRRLVITISTSEPATLTILKRHYRVAKRTRLQLTLPNRPITGALRIPATLTAPHGRRLTGEIQLSRG